ncbi:hypothetical protein [Hyphomicrobium sp. NDB2Meth4]|uniref:DMP19 family protein n=1 Tax=Hyphomicrobium sp. NDB2Meth4 TaxID=1892846 RepID=UPI0009309BE6|nr:hypothetical protein [Hyphomicrobium sp. NDB2Meth4]
MAWSFFGKRDEPPSVRKIIASRSAYESPDPSKIVQQTVDFVNAMLQRGAYLRSEIPINAMRSYHVDYYLAQVSNGGHGQFVGNSRWQPLVVEDISVGLDAMGAKPFVGIFRDLRALMDGDPERGRAIGAAFGFGPPDPAEAALDKRYFAQDAYKTLLPANAAWLRTLPELKVVPDEVYPTEIGAICNANPQRTARLAARRRQSMAQIMADPLRVAARLLSVKANCLPVLAFGGGDPSAIAPDGRNTTAWTIQTRTGPFEVFIFDDVALLCSKHLADGRQLTNEVMAETERSMANGNRTSLAAFASMTRKEVARIPASEIAGAIAAAKQMPIVRFAELLCAKLDQDEELQDVYAAVLHRSGQWLWLMQTSKRAALFGFNAQDLVLTDPRQEKRLAVLGPSEIRKAIKEDALGQA